MESGNRGNISHDSEDHHTEPDCSKHNKDTNNTDDSQNIAVLPVPLNSTDLTMPINKSDTAVHFNRADQIISLNNRPTDTTKNLNGADNVTSPEAPVVHCDHIDIHTIVIHREQESV